MQIKIDGAVHPGVAGVTSAPYAPKRHSARANPFFRKPFIMRTILKVAILALSLFGAAAVGAQGMPQMTRVTGKVAAISTTQIVLTKADGTAATIPLLPNWVVIVSRPISVDQIQPGSYLGTTNYAKPDGTGVSLEVHAFPTGMKGPGLDFVMDANAGTTMTNGVVGTVTQSAAGRVLSVDYGHGVRVITVPPGVPVVLNTPGDRSAVTVGETVTVGNVSRPDGDAQFVSIGGQ
jgi:hypothetical protein